MSRLAEVESEGRRETGLHSGFFPKLVPFPNVNCSACMHAKSLRSCP